MANTLEYILSLNDKMSSKLSKIGITSDNALNKFAKLQQQANQTSKLMNDMGGSVGALREKLSLLKSERDWIPQSNVEAIKKYNREIQNLDKKIQHLETTGSKTKGVFANAFSQIPFAGLLTNPFVIAGAVGGKAIKLGIEQEMQKTSFEVLLNGKEAGKKMFDDISNYAKISPYEKMGLGDAAKTMLGFGIAQKNVMPSLKMLGDVAMGDANKLQSLTLAFSQISSAGKMQGQDLLQLINAGFNPLQEISKMTGKSMGDLRKDMEKGNISFAMVQKAFQNATAEGGKFHGMSDKMGQTLGGKLSTAMDTINDLLLSLFNVISPILIPAVQIFTQTIEFLTPIIPYLISPITMLVDTLKWMFQLLNSGNPIMVVLASVLTGVGIGMAFVKTQTMLKTIWDQKSVYWSKAVTLWNNLTSASWWKLNVAMLANPIVWVIAGVIALIAIISYLTYKVDGWGKMWDYTLKAMKSYYMTWFYAIKTSVLTLGDVFMTAFEKIQYGWYKVKSLWDKDGAKKGMEAIQKQSEARKKALAESKDKTIENAKNTVKYTMLAAGSLKWNDKKTLGGLATEMKNKVGLGDNKIKPVKGVAGTTDLKGNNGTDSSLNQDLQKSNESIVSGGSKSNVTNITFRNLVENISVAKDNLKDTSAEIEKQVMDAMLRVLAMAKTV